MPNKKKLSCSSAGAADGLNIVVRSAKRITTAFARRHRDSQPRQGVEGAGRRPRRFFRLASSLAPLGHCFITAARHRARSRLTRHDAFPFRPQDFHGIGTPGVKSTDDGGSTARCKAAHEENSSPFRAVAMSESPAHSARSRSCDCACE